MLLNCDDGESKSLWLDYDWKQQPVPEESLFDLVFDPNETNNLVEDAARQDILETMRERLRRWMKTRSDPLLNDDIRQPVQ